MKKFLSVAMSAIIACASIFSCTLTAFAENAETEDVTIDCSSATTCSNWEQSITVDQATFNATRLTKDSEIIVTFKSEEINEKAGNKYNAELIFQSWDNTTTPAAQDGAVWAKIAPVKFDDSSATYDFESIATAYGTDDFSQVYNIIIGATDRAKITVTGITVTNCKTKAYAEKEEKDSKGTNPDAAIKGIQAMVAPTFLIGGGYDKGSEYDEWIEAFDGKVKWLVLIGQTAQKIADCAKRHGFNSIIFEENLQDAVAYCHENAVDGDAVLLSPACASWGQFDNYEQRGDMFKEYVRSYKE